MATPTQQLPTQPPSLDKRVTELEKKMAILEKNNSGFFKEEEEEKPKKDGVITGDNKSK